MIFWNNFWRILCKTYGEMLVDLRSNAWRTKLKKFLKDLGMQEFFEKFLAYVLAEFLAISGGTVEKCHKKLLEGIPMRSIGRSPARI